MQPVNTRCIDQNLTTMNDFFEHEDDDSLSDLLERFDTMLSEDAHYFFDVEEYEDLIDHYLSINDLKKCSSAISHALEQYPGHSNLMIRQAQLLVSTNKAEKALRVLARVEDIDPSNSDIYITKGAIYSQLKRYDDAIKEYNKALSQGEILSSIYSNIMDRHPYSRFAWFNLGVAYNNIELFEKAIEAFDFAIAIEPTFSSAYFNKANSLAGMQMYHHAIAAYRETFEHEEPEALTYYYIGECYEKTGELDKAIENFRKTIEMDENIADAWVGLGVCYEEKGNAKSALR